MRSYKPWASSGPHVQISSDCTIATNDPQPRKISCATGTYHYESATTGHVSSFNNDACLHVTVREYREERTAWAQRDQLQ
jgi:hypothetical protein